MTILHCPTLSCYTIGTVSICITLSVDSALAVAWTIPDHETASRGSVNVAATTDITRRVIILKVHNMHIG